MTKFQQASTGSQITKLTGIITDYQCEHGSASFIYSQNDQNRMGAVAIAAALAGMGGQATSIASYTTNMEEPADYLEFTLNGYSVKGWVWRSPFKEGETVNVAAEWKNDHYELFGISRPADKTIALYPHCSRSVKPHIKNAVKWSASCMAIFFSLAAAFFIYAGGPKLLIDPGTLWSSSIIFSLLTLMFVSLTRKYMPFVRLSEKVFRVLELPDPENIDLVKSSKKQRTADDRPELGVFYFKY